VILNRVSDLFTLMLQLERRFDPFIRPAFDAVLRDPVAELTTALINRQRPNEGLKIAEEKLMPDEEAYLDSIISSFTKQMHLLWKSGAFERGGNTKTHGIVRGEFIVHENLPATLRHGIYAEPKTYRAWVRFSGPGPYITPDIEDVGFMSISIKLLGVPGPKLMDDEKFTQDMFGVSTPTFVTPDTKANAQLQIESVKERPDLLLSQPSSPPRVGPDHAVFVDQDAEQSLGSSLLQLRALFARGRAGNAIFHLAEVDRENAHSAAPFSASERLFARGYDCCSCRR
jgi:hypothetical protein